MKQEEIIYQEVHSQRILNPTSINLGEYVINPYLGCAFNCLYCYARSNRAVTRRTAAWGKFVDVRINAPDLLIHELAVKKPQCVLLGSTTECFQPIEKKIGLSQELLDILNKHRVHYIILTRSPLIVSALPLLKKGYCKRIYFTINNYTAAFKARLEPSSPSFEEREEAIRSLIEAGLTVIPYFSPVLPGISDFSDLFIRYRNTACLEFECLNFRLANIDAIITAIGEVDACLQEKYRNMQTDEACYKFEWEAFEKKLAVLAREAETDSSGALLSYQVYRHQFGDYFKNVYTKP